MPKDAKGVTGCEKENVELEHVDFFLCEKKVPFDPGFLNLKSGTRTADCNRWTDRMWENNVDQSVNAFFMM